MMATRLRDVTLRDGLQDEVPVPTVQKVALFEALARSGVRELELTSFVRSDRVPALADAEEFAALTAGSNLERWALVLNSRGAERAFDAGIERLQFVVSVSDTHSRYNAGRSLDDALREFQAVAQMTSGDVKVEATIATAFGCPYMGRIPQSSVVEVAEQVAASGATSVTVADTIGVAIPNDVVAMLDGLIRAVKPLPVGIHLHDTRGLGIANALAALEVGVHRLDGSLGGLGGCPFAPGASGNIALEDLVHVLEESGIRTGIELEALLDASRLACELVGRPVQSHVAVAGRRFGHLAALD